ncbi:hypothetical protein ACX8XN_18540 [Calditrichota bacterium GD2]
MIGKYSDRDLIEILNGEWKGRRLSSREQRKLLLEAIKDDSAFWYLMISGDQQGHSFYKSLWTDKSRTSEIVQELVNDPRLTELFKQKPSSKLEPKERPASIEFGQIYETRLPINWPYPYQERRMVLVLSNHEGSFNPYRPDVKVAPISFDTHLAGPYDVCFEHKKLLGGVTFLVRLSDVQNIFVDQLANYYGRLSRKNAHQVVLAWKRSLGLKVDEDESQHLEKSNNIVGRPSETSAQQEQQQFWRREHKITRYMREPVLSMIRAHSQWPEAIVLDLTYGLPGDVLKQWEQTANLIPLAAASRPDLSIYAAQGPTGAFTVFSEEDVLCKFMYSNDWVGLLFVLKNNQEIRLKIQHNNREILSETLAPEDQIAYLSLRGIKKLLNKELRLQIQMEKRIISKKVVLHYGSSV